MYLSRPARMALRAFTGVVLVVLYVPLLYVARLSLATSRGFSWPPSGFTLEHWSDARDADGPREALVHSLTIAAWATVVALVEEMRKALAEVAEQAGSPGSLGFCFEVCHRRL